MDFYDRPMRSPPSAAPAWTLSRRLSAHYLCAEPARADDPQTTHLQVLHRAGGR